MTQIIASTAQRSQLIAARKAMGDEWTQTYVASRLGISRQYYGMIEQGRRTPPLQLSLRISRLLGVPIESLLPVHEQMAV